MRDDLPHTRHLTKIREKKRGGSYAQVSRGLVVMVNKAFASCAVIAMTMGSGYGQDMGFGRISEAERFMSNFRRQASASTVKQDLIRRDTTVATGFGTRSVGTPTYSNLNQGSMAPPRRQSASFGVGNAGEVSKPFASVTARPTISPYLNLFREDFGEAGDLNYQTLVRPQLQQDQFNSQVVRQAQAINQRLSSISARNAYNTRGSENMMPTGHSATFQYYSRFYPQKGQRRR